MEEDKCCSKCGISLEYNNHSEKDCDFVPIDWDNIEELTHVDDHMIGETDIAYSVGFGVIELVHIFKIMRMLWIDGPPVDKHVNQLGAGYQSKLFRKAVEIYKNN